VFPSKKLTGVSSKEADRCFQQKNELPVAAHSF
jgi:hypothetical protein